MVTMLDIPSIRNQQQSGTSMVIGIISAVLSSMCQSIGLILQRKSHLHYENTNNRKIYKPPYKRSLWRIGFLLFLISNIFGSSIQITTLPLIILSPLQSIGLVFNSLFSSLILHEVFTQNSLIGTILIGIGAFLILIFGRIPEPNYNLDQFIDFLKRRRFVYWCCLNTFVVSSLLTWIILSINSELLIKREEVGFDVLEQESENSEEEDEEESLVLENDNFINSTTSHEYEHFQQGGNYESSNMQKLINDQLVKSKKILNKVNIKIYKRFFKLSLENSNLLQGIFFGWISGTLSGFSLLLAKSTIEILVNCITSKSNLHKILSQPMIWIIISSFLILCLSQLWFLNQGLKLITTSILYPLVFCIYNIVNIGNELIFYNQWAIVTMWQLLNIFIGTLLVFAGVLLLSWRLDDNTEQVEDSTPLLRHNLHSNHFHNNHQRNFSLESNTTNKRVGLSSILHNKFHDTVQESERSSLKSSPVFKNYFTFTNNNNNNNNNSVNNNTIISPARSNRKSLSINTSMDDDLDEGHSEYISFGSPNNKFSPSTSESTLQTLQQQDLLLSPLSITKQQSSVPTLFTPTKVKYDINGFQTTDLDQSSNVSISSNTDVNSNQITPKKRYGSIGNIFGGSQQSQSSHHHQQQKHNRNSSRRVLSFEQNQLLGQLQNTQF